MHSYVAIAPLELYPVEGLRASLPIELGHGVSVAANSRELYDDKLLKQALGDRLTNESKRAAIALNYTFEAEELDAPDKTWKRGGEPKVADRAWRYLSWAYAALWLAQPTQAYYRIVLIRDLDSNLSYSQCSQRASRAWALFHRKRARVDATHLQLASRLLDAIIRSEETYNPISAARYTLELALEQVSWEARYLLLWVALEALFGPEGATEVTFRLCQRLALFWENSPEQRRELFSRLKESYSYRSKVAHGLKPIKLKNASFDQELVQIEELIRTALVKILRNTYLTKVFLGRTRERYLDGLAFGSVLEEPESAPT
jgi:hypothetical protein